MSETVVTIHYQSPAEDPFKVPRPTVVCRDAAGNIQTTGGEGELQGDQLIGLSRSCPVATHSLAVCGPPELFDPENWVQAGSGSTPGAVPWTAWRSRSDEPPIRASAMNLAGQYITEAKLRP